MDDCVTCTSVSPGEQAVSVFALADEQAVISEGVEVEQVSRVSMEDLTQTHAEGYASSMLSDTVELEDFVSSYQECSDFNNIYKLSGPRLISIHNMFIQNIPSVQMVCYVSMMEKVFVHV